MTEIIFHKDEDWEKRILCSDESCIGTIGPDTKCRDCGKPYDGKLSEGQMPIIFLTNLSDEKTLSSGQQAGVYDYLVKATWTLDGIIKKIKDKFGE